MVGTLPADLALTAHASDGQTLPGAEDEPIQSGKRKAILWSSAALIVLALSLLVAFLLLL